MSVFQVTEDILAFLGQHVIHHIIGDVNVCFGVLVMFSVVQLKSNILKDKNNEGKCKLPRSIS